MSRRYLILIYLLFIYPANCFSQNTIDTLEYIVQTPVNNLLYSNYNKQLNTYFLNTGFNFSGKFSALNLRVLENFRSTLFKSTTNSIRDEQYLLLSGKYRLNNNYKFGIVGSSSFLSDDRNIQLNETSISYATLFSEIRVMKDLYFTPFGGYTNNKQFGEFDNGIIYGFEGVANNLTYPEFTISSQLRFRNEDIFPRRNLLRYFNLVVTNPFNPSVTNNIIGRYSSSRKDFYLPADSITSSSFDIVNNIESRTESIFFAQDGLVYNNFLNLFAFNMTGGINWRTIDRNTRYKTVDLQSPSLFDTKIEELILSVESALNYYSSSFDGSLRLTYAERDEKHITKPFEGSDESFFEQRSELESRKNNNSVKASVALAGIFKISGTDKLIFSLYQSKLRYDTPSQYNDDDRDEILSIARLRYSQKLSPFFEAFINLEGTYSHVVYIYASRSSNNNVNQVLRFTAGGYYQGADISSLNKFEVSANYTVYDFEDLSSSLRSFSFRQFTATDSSRLKLGSRFAFVLTGYIKLSEQADLNWGEFAERPTRFFQEIFADPKFILTYNKAYFGLGLRYFSLNTFNYKRLTKLPETKYRSVGPLIEVFYNVYSSLYLKINGWYEFITISDLHNREQSNLIMALNWNF
ncbi:hypothetical protein BMS3Abin03_02487 [bacterium BMS3Abin03]|nr:hypothetical protein BMS3Abin03_02487 [bacterium BMS3Abin03]